MLSLADHFTLDKYTVKFLICCLLGAYTAYYFHVARSVLLVFNLISRLPSLPRWTVTLRNSWNPFVLISPFLVKFTRLSFLVSLVECRRYWGPFSIASKCVTMKSGVFVFCTPPSIREVIGFPDGGEMMLSWSNLEGMADNTPVVVLLPGLTGCGCCLYIASLDKEITRCKYRWSKCSFLMLFSMRCFKQPWNMPSQVECKSNFIPPQQI